MGVGPVFFTRFINLARENFDSMQNEQPSEWFEKAFTNLFYLMFSADKVADLREFQLGSAIMKLENMNKPKAMEDIDFLANMPRNQVHSEALDALKKCNGWEQLKCLAYMKMVARIDGSIADKELYLIEEICQNEVKKDLYEVLKMEQELKPKIQQIIDEGRP